MLGVRLLKQLLPQVPGSDPAQGDWTMTRLQHKHGFARHFTIELKH